MRDWMIYQLILWLIIANATPLLIARILGSYLARPLDAGRLLADNRPLFGSHKTWRGIIVALSASMLVAPVFGHSLVTGALFGSLSMLGDLLSSFIKRRLACRPGRNCPLLDQLPESVLPLVLLQPVLGSNALETASAVVAFILIDLLGSRLLVADQQGCR